MNRKLVITLTGLILCCVTISGCGGPARKVKPTASEQFQLAKSEYDKKHYIKATEEFQKVIFNYPGATIVDTAQYYLAMSYYGNKEYESAGVEFNRLIVNYYRSEYIDEAQFLSGMCYIENTPRHYALDQEDLKMAINALEDFIIDNPDSPLVEEAQESIREALTKLARKNYRNGVTYFRLYDYKAARIYFQKVIDDFTNTEFAAKALYKLSESYYKEKNYTLSQEKFNNFQSLYPDNELIPKAKKYLEIISQKIDIENASGKSD